MGVFAVWKNVTTSSSFRLALEKRRRRSGVAANSAPLQKCLKSLLESHAGR